MSLFQSPEKDGRQKKTNSRAISFFSGLVFVSVVVAYTVNKNQELRDEISRQFHRLLNVTRDVVSQAELIVNRTDTITRLLKPDYSEQKNNSFENQWNKGEVKEDALGQAYFSEQSSNGQRGEKTIEPGLLETKYDEFWKNLP